MSDGRHKIDMRDIVTAEEKFYNKERFINETPIHGVREFAAEKNLVGKIGWTIMYIISLVAMFFQLAGLFRDFTGQKLGTRIERWMPTRFPTLLFCPPDNQIDMKKVEEMGYDPNVAEYPFFYLFAYKAYDVENKELYNTSAKRQYYISAAEKLIAEYESVNDYFFNVTYDKVKVVSYTDRPENFHPYQIRKILTVKGVCYEFRIMHTFGSIEIAWTQIELKMGYDLWLYAGEDSTYGIQWSYPNKLFADKSYSLQFVQTKHAGYNTRRRPCVMDPKYTREDYYVCTFEYNNKKHCKPNCIMFVPNRHRFNMTKLCSLYSPDYMDCVFNIYMFNESTVCPLPCTYVVTRTTIIEEKPLPNRVGKILMELNDPQDFKVQEEYPIFTVESFVSNLGGTISLWFGASILSFFHIGYFCSCCCFYRRKTIIRQITNDSIFSIA